MPLKIKRGGFLETFLPAMMQLKMTREQSDIYEQSKLREQADYFNKLKEDRLKQLNALAIETFIKTAGKEAEGQPFGALGALKTFRDVLPADVAPAGLNLPADLPMKVAASRAALTSGLSNVQAGQDVSPEDIAASLEGYGQDPTLKVLLQAIQNKIDREKLASSAAGRDVAREELAVREDEIAARLKSLAAEETGRGRKLQAGTLENIDEQLTTSKGREQLYMRDLATELKKQNIKVPENITDVNDLGQQVMALLVTKEIQATPEIEEVLTRLDDERAKQEQLYVERSAVTGDLGKQAYDSLVAELKAKGFKRIDLEKNQDLIGWLKSQSIDIGVLKRAFK